MRDKAINVLIEMGMPSKNKGFKYIVDAMCLFNEHEKLTNVRMMDLYKLIAEMNDVTASRVERCIRHSFAFVLENGDIDVVNKYLSFNYKSNSNLLATLFWKLKMEVK